MSDTPYSDTVWAHFDNPGNIGRWSEDAAEVRTGEARTPAGQDVLHLHMRVRDGLIRESRFQAYGSVAVIAVGSWLSEWLRGRSVAEARDLDSARIAEQLDLAAVQRYCAIMGQDALRAALSARRETRD